MKSLKENMEFALNESLLDRDFEWTSDVVEYVKSHMVTKNSSKQDSFGRPLNIGDIVWAQNYTGQYVLAEIISKGPGGRCVIDYGQDAGQFGWDGQPIGPNVVWGSDFIYPQTGLIKVDLDFLNFIKGHVTEGYRRGGDSRKAVLVTVNRSRNFEYLREQNNSLVRSRSKKLDSFGRQLHPDDIVLGVTGMQGSRSCRELTIDYYRNGWWYPDYGLLKINPDVIEKYFV